MLALRRPTLALRHANANVTKSQVEPLSSTSALWYSLETLIINPNSTTSVYKASRPRLVNHQLAAILVSLSLSHALSHSCKRLEPVPVCLINMLSVRAFRSSVSLPVYVFRGH